MKEYGICSISGMGRNGRRVMYSTNLKYNNLVGVLEMGTLRGSLMMSLLGSLCIECGDTYPDWKLNRGYERWVLDYMN